MTKLVPSPSHSPGFNPHVQLQFSLNTARSMYSSTQDRAGQCRLANDHTPPPHNSPSPPVKLKTGTAAPARPLPIDYTQSEVSPQPDSQDQSQR